MTLELCIALVTLATYGTKQSIRIYSKNQMIITLTLIFKIIMSLPRFIPTILNQPI